jgi:hypothetical protein
MMINRKVVTLFMSGYLFAAPIPEALSATNETTESATTSTTENAADTNAIRNTDSARALSSEVNDPIAPLALIQFRNVFAPSVPGYTGSANLLEIQPVIPVAASDRIPIDQLIIITIPIVTSPEPGRTTGLGDLQLVDMVTTEASWGHWSLGVVAIFPTAKSPELGEEKWQFGPMAGIIYTAIENLEVGAELLNPVSIAGNSNSENVHSLSITPTLNYDLPGGWFYGLSDLDWVVDWKNGGDATIPIGLRGGKVFAVGTENFSFSLQGAYSVVRPDDAPRWLVGLEFNWIFPEPTKTE